MNIITLILMVIMINLFGCQSQITPSNLEIPTDTQAQLQDLLFPVDYGKLINLSLEGDGKSLVKLIRLSQYTSGGGAYGLGDILSQIALKIGDASFAETITVLSSQELENLHYLLLAGFEYGNPQYKIEDFALLLPKTYTMTKPK
jgi:hypothetical protein